jgi:hypothetical protein
MCRLEFQQVEKAKFTGVAGRRSSGVAGVARRRSSGVAGVAGVQENGKQALGVAKKSIRF